MSARDGAALALVLALAACGGRGDRPAADGGPPRTDAAVDAHEPVGDAGPTPAPCEALPHGWIGEAVPEHTGRDELRLALDPSGVAVLAFTSALAGVAGGDALYFASRADGFAAEHLYWDSTAVDGVAVAVTPDGTPLVVYARYQSSGTVRAARRGGEWVEESLQGDRTADVSNVAVTAGGDPWIVHDGALYALWWAGSRDGVWSEEIIDDGSVEGGMRSVGLHNALVLDAAGTAHVTHMAYSANTLFYVTGGPGAWTRTTVDDSVTPDRTSVAVAPGGEVHVAYRDDAGVVVASGGAGGFSFEVIDGADEASAPRIARSASGDRHLLYLAASTGELRWAEDSAGSWAIRPLATAATDAYDLVAGEDGALHAVWVDGSTRSICYASLTP